jgi:hypothetical protein
MPTIKIKPIFESFSVGLLCKRTIKMKNYSSTRISIFCASLLITWSCLNAQTNYLDESFSGTSTPEWVFVTGMGTGAVLTASADMPSEQRDDAGEGWLRLTHDLQNQASFVYYTNSLPTSEGLVFSFDFAIWTTANRPAADGFVLALFEPTDSPDAGGYGGSLGYPKRRNEFFALRR